MSSDYRPGFHNIMDCLVPVYGMIEEITSGRVTLSCTDVLLVPSHLRDRIPLFLAKYAQYVVIQTPVLSGTRPKTCLNIKPGVTVTYTLHRMNRAGVLSGQAQRMRHAAWQAIELQHADYQKLYPPQILLINRTQTRVIQDFDSVAAFFAKRFPRATIKVYDGTESFVDTVRLFATSEAVVGWHGAAAANMVFARPGSLMVEGTTTRDLAGTLLWRSNHPRVMEYNPHLRWALHVLRLRTLLRANRVTADMMPPLEKMDIFIKKLQRVRFRPLDLEKIAATVAEHLRRRARAHRDMALA